MMQNTEEVKKVDRRVVRTKRAICNAFAQLLAIKNINEITIKDIADTADVNRKTVYNYYSGIHEILDEIENEVVSTYEKLLQNYDFRNGLKDPSELFVSLTSVLSSNMDFYSSLLKIDSNSQLITKIVSTLKSKLRDVFITQNIFPRDKLDLIISYTVAGMVAAYQSWFNSDREQPIEEFSKDISRLVFSGAEALANSHENP